MAETPKGESIAPSMSEQIRKRADLARRMFVHKPHPMGDADEPDFLNQGQPESAPIAHEELIGEFIAYWTTDRAHGNAEVGCGMCGGIPHSTTCFVGRFAALASSPAQPSLQGCEACEQGFCAPEYHSALSAAPPAQPYPSQEDRWCGVGAPMSRGAVLGIGDEGWAELSEVEHRGLKRRNAPTSGVVLNWRTFRSVMNVLRDLKLEHFAQPNPETPQGEELATCIKVRNSYQEAWQRIGSALVEAGFEDDSTEAAVVSALQELALLRASQPPPEALRAEVLERAIRIVESEEELDGPMPEENRRLAEQLGPEAHARAVVRSTKQSIVRRLDALSASPAPHTERTK